MSTSGVVRLFCYFVAIFLVLVIVSASYMGIRDFMTYKNIVQPGLELSGEVFRFFTRQALHREWQKLTAAGLEDNSQVVSFNLYLGESDIASLNSDLPTSGKSQYISGHLDAPALDFSSAGDFRYRGGLPLHWLYEKKSYRVKLPPYKQLYGDQSFNLVNPSTMHSVTDLIMYSLSADEGLLAPDYYPARVFVNDRYQGLHFYLSEVDESLLRKKDRMPGSIYSGDTVYSPSYFGDEKSIHQEGVFVDGDRMALFWRDPRLWKKESSRNAESKQYRDDIDRYVSIINTEDSASFYELFNRYFDKRKYYTFWGIDTLFGGYHHDNFHNHKIYFDPYKGKFEPIQWDFRFWSVFAGKDIPVNPLISKISLNPILEYERDTRTYNLLQKYSVGKVVNLIDDADSLLKPELKSDPFRQAPDHRYIRFQLAKVTPFSMGQYESAIQELKKTYGRRRAFVEAVLSNTVTNYRVSPSERGFFIDISVDGNTPAIVDFSNILRSESSKLYKIHGGQRTVQRNHSEQLLYPGRTRVDGNVVGRMDNWSVTAFGNYRFAPSPLHYRYEVELMADDGASFEKNFDLNVMNALTEKPVEASRVEVLPSDSDTLSVHPWTIKSAGVGTLPIILEGAINVPENRVFSEETIVTIRAGTEFIMGPKASILFRGKVLAEGAESSPIVFRAREPLLPWGAVVIQGADAAGSSFHHIQFDGGSVASFNLINYPGIFNIHDVPEFLLTNCAIRNTHTGDDGLHVAYSEGRIEKCEFENTEFDAIDIDISRVELNHIFIDGAGNDGIDVMNSKILIRDLRVAGAGDKCVSVGEGSVLALELGMLQNCAIGVAIKDESVGDLTYVDFQLGDATPIALYRKNTRYSRGGVVDGHNLSGFDIKAIDIGPASQSHLSKEDLN